LQAPHQKCHHLLEYLDFSQKISGLIGPEARAILFQAIANGWVVSRQHINLLGEYDFSDEKLQDSVEITSPKKISRLKAA
jgi:hypothetical protein